MTLIKSISGIRGTIGGNEGDGLSPADIVKFTTGYGTWLKRSLNIEKGIVVVGRDARISGEMVYNIISGTLLGLGLDVVNIGMATTPTTEIAVTNHNADGGIIITASHNPKQWNALKLLNNKGEFLNSEEGEEVLRIAEDKDYSYVDVDDLGKITEDNTQLNKHIQAIINLNLVDIDAIKKANFTVAVDGVNSVGGLVIPKLLKAIGVQNVLELYCEPNGIFPHNPEPLPENLTEISTLIETDKVDVGFVVDPDVDRLAIINEDGTMFGEEYTLVAVADYILQNKKGNTVSNLSSTRALRDVTVKNGGEYAASSVGEVNVVAKMKETNAVIGGEGNGGVIYPELHYGRDALVGIALFLTYLAKSEMKCSELRATYPEYFISKNKIQLTPKIDVDNILKKVEEKYKNENLLTIDGVKIDFADAWVHLRKSNTEPIIRIYSESNTMQNADKIANEIIDFVKSIS